ncbi:E3 ubiquitin-protein ligase HTD1 [Tritrichomonas musculus]|uniref:E3 ubiquitin-protein ligase HTD1 n=1 Tax=Tritrichomonas musculus TaxID=1915356 RepID=A0ABR2GWH8_9EUKA
MIHSIRLQSEAVMQLPFQNYEKDFTFIVNSERFDTSTFAADLLSTNISKIHFTDPTLKEFSIDTETKGDFNKVLNLLNFEYEEIVDQDIPFFIEVIDILKIDKIDFNVNQEEEATINNIFDHIKKHQNHPRIYSKQLDADIQFFTSHFHELKGKFEREIYENGINDAIIEKVVSNRKLQLESEEELLDFVNNLYKKDTKYSSLYEYVEFVNVGAEGMKKFTEIFDFSDMNNSTWKSIVYRLEEPVKAGKNRSRHEYLNKQQYLIEIENKENEFDGIFNYLQNNGNIRDEVNITCSSINVGDPFNLLQYNNKQNYFQTQDETNSWICFEFKNHAVIPSGYIIRSYCDENESHPKTWKFEGSNDLQSWATLDSQTNNDSLRGGGRVHLFPISGNEDKDKPFKYLRIRQTGSNWYEYENGSYYDLLMNSFEIYGRVI